MPSYPILAKFASYLLGSARCLHFRPPVLNWIVYIASLRLAVLGMNRVAAEIQAAATECIRIRGARMHNLQNIDLDIPRDRFVVITGPSGSGKSSLAFDTLYAEGQRQYIESLSTYARQFLHQLERPDVDLIDGLQPTISIDQRAGTHNPRSTVATVTEIYDYLRLLFARLGEARCYQCGEPIHPTDAGANSRCNAGTEFRHPGDDSRAAGEGAQGGAQGRLRVDPEAGLSPRSRRWPDRRRQRAALLGGAESAQHRGGDRSRRGA